jgi:hypothetical protein
VEVGPDPHGVMATGTGSSKAGVKYDHKAPRKKMRLTKEEKDILDTVNTGDPVKIHADGTVEVG